MNYTKYLLILAAFAASSFAANSSISDKVVSNRDLARALNARENFIAYCKTRNDDSALATALEDHRLLNIFVDELLKIKDVEALDYQDVVINGYKTIITAARKGVKPPFGLLNLIDTEEFNTAISLAVSLTGHALEAAMKHCKHMENKLDYNKCMISQGVDDYFVLRLAFASKDLSIGTVVYHKLFEELEFSLSAKLDENQIVNAMNACETLKDNSDLVYSQCMTNQGISDKVVQYYALLYKNSDPIDYHALIIRAEKGFINTRLMSDSELFSNIPLEDIWWL